MSAAQFTILGINAAKPFLDNSDYWARKGRNTVEKIRRKSVSKVYGEDPRDDWDRRPHARPRGGFIAERSKSTGNYSDYSSDDEDYYRTRGTRGRDRRQSGKHSHGLLYR